MLTKSERDLRTFMAIAQRVAIARARTMPTTPDIERSVDALVSFAKARLAELRCRELASGPPSTVRTVLRVAIRSLSRTEVIARLAAIGTEHPELSLARRIETTMTDDDLRTALEDAESRIAFTM